MEKLNRLLTIYVQNFIHTGKLLERKQFYTYGQTVRTQTILTFVKRAQNLKRLKGPKTLHSARDFFLKGKCVKDVSLIDFRNFEIFKH